MKVKSLLLAGVVLATTIGGANYINASPESSEDKAYGGSALDNIIGFMDLTDMINDLEILTAEEKARLLETEKKNEAYYKKLDEISSKIDRIFERVFEGSEHLQEDLSKLLDKHEELWNKLYAENLNINLEEMPKFIKDSKVLTENEKAILLENELEIQKVEKLLDEKYKKVDELSRHLDDESSKIYEKIQKNDDENADIWEKINENNKNKGYTIYR